MCGFRLFYAEDHFSRRAWPYLVSVCGNFALLAQIPPRRGLAFGKSCDRRSDRERGIKKFVFAFPSLLARPLRAAAHFRAARLFFPILTYPLFGHCRKYLDGRRPKIWLCGRAACRAHRLFAALLIRAFFDRCTGVGDSRPCHWTFCLEIRQHTAE